MLSTLVATVPRCGRCRVPQGMTGAPRSRDDRLEVFPHIESCLSMTMREWLYFHNVMHRHYTRYRGRTMLKPPFDWVVLGDIIDETRPDLVIEIGSFEGGTTLWIADHLDAIGADAEVIGID